MSDELIKKMDVAAAKLLAKMDIKSLEMSENTADNTGTHEILSADQEIKIFEAVGKWMMVKNRLDPDKNDPERGGLNDFKQQLKADSDQRASSAGAYDDDDDGDEYDEQPEQPVKPGKKIGRPSKAELAEREAAKRAREADGTIDDEPWREPPPRERESRKRSTGGDELQALKQQAAAAAAASNPNVHSSPSPSPTAGSVPGGGNGAFGSSSVTVGGRRGVSVGASLSPRSYGDDADSGTNL